MISSAYRLMQQGQACAFMALFRKAWTWSDRSATPDRVGTEPWTAPWCEKRGGRG